LKSKLRAPDLIEFVKSFDIVCFSETKLTDYDTVTIPGFELHVNNNGIRKRKVASGGVGLLISDKIKDKVKILEPKSDHILWAIVDKSVLGYDKDILIGSVYIPPERSRYSDIDMFTEIEEELVDICSQEDGTYDVIIAGDFNAHFGTINENVNFEELEEFEPNIVNAVHNILSDESSLEELGLSVNRNSEETSPHNNYGYRLIEMCKSLGLYVLNGRVGQDKQIGKVTCNKCIDDVFMGNPRILSLTEDFYVDTFNPLFSDKHSPVCTSLKSATPVNAQTNSENVNVNDEQPKCKPRWHDELKDVYVNNIDLSLIQDVESRLSQLERAESVQKNEVDAEIDKICNIFENAAYKSFPLSQRGNGIKNEGKKKRKLYHQKEWFNEDCKQSRQLFCKAHNRYRSSKNDENFESMKVASRNYKRTMKICYRKHKKAVDKKIRNLKSTNPKEYWKIVNPKCRSGNDVFKQVSADALHEHFKKLSKAPPDHLGDEPLELDIDYDNEVLNRRIEPEEIKKVIHNLKSGKAKGIDCIGNEEIKATEDSMINIYCKLFNIVFDTGIIPTAWSIGVIQSLYKNKGDPKDPDNYRGITLLSCLGKVFTAVINNRLGEFSKGIGLINNEQAGFRPGCSTVDHVFALNCLLDIYLSKGQKIFCGFIDYKKAFDTVWRAGLWTKVLQADIKGKIIRVMINLYDGAKSSIKTPDGTSESFPCQMGVRQGENLSPFLFALYLNDLASFMENEGSDGLKHLNHYSKCNFLNELGIRLKLFVLLYADDTILLSDSASGLQEGLNIMERYCNLWKLSINESKTKVIIFSRGKAKKDPPIFLYKGKRLEIVDDYTYLGITFNYNGSFTKAKKKRYEQASRAMFGLIRHCRKMDLSVDICSELFDRMVSPILLYGCEVWGFEDISILERLHLKFSKLILKVSKYTPSCMVYNELGRFPLKKIIQERMINYWAKLVSSRVDEKWCNVLYNIVRDQHEHGYLNSKWCSFVKSTLNECGLGYLWTNPIFNPKWLKTTLKLNLEDQFRQNIR